ncbi:exonuclease domain-containing protein [Sarocladium implicatum]|nr:exonuclease domain-containing protein [Sarocladium implicatum]
MAGLSSNWKKLQAKLKSEGSASTATKRKADDSTPAPAKKRKVSDVAAKKLQPKPESKSKAPEKRPRKAMGAVQSVKVPEGPGYGPSPSLALWAEDNDISGESLAEAYGLGLNGNSMMLAGENDKVNRGLTEGINIGKYVAIDCEMVGVGPGGYESSLARVSIVDFHGRQVYDSYVKQRERVTDYRTEWSGISAKEMRFAREFDEVQKAVADIMADRILVGHDIKHDLDVLKLSHPARDIRDTARHHAFKKHGNSRKPALRNLARELLNIQIQEGAHSSVEDARVTMLLFRKHKSAFDVDHANRFAPKAPKGGPSNGKKAKKGKKKG